MTTISQINYIQASYAGGATLADPTATGVGTPGYYGPDFLAAGVPEPATWALMLVGLGLGGASLRTRRGNAMAAA